MTAKEFLLHPDNLDKTLPQILDAYAIMIIESINDEDINQEAKLADSTHFQNGYYFGAKWLLQQLKNNIKQ